MKERWRLKTIRTYCWKNRKVFQRRIFFSYLTVYNRGAWCDLTCWAYFEPAPIWYGGWWNICTQRWKIFVHRALPHFLSYLFFFQSVRCRVPWFFTWTIIPFDVTFFLLADILAASLYKKKSEFSSVYYILIN